MGRDLSVRATWFAGAARRGVLAIAGGTAAAQLVAAAVAPALTRLYGTDEFGLLSVFAAALAIVVVVAAFRFELAIPLVPDDTEAVGLLTASLLALGISTAALAGLIAAVGQEAANAANVPALGEYLWMLPVGVFVAGLYRVLSFWLIRSRRYSIIARTKLAQALTMTGTQLGLGLFGLGPVGLLLGHVVGQATGVTALARYAPRSAIRWRYDHLFRTIRKHWRYPVFSSVTGVVGTLSYHVPTLVIASAFGSAAAGLYGLSTSVLQGPTILVGQAVGQVFSAEAGAASRDGTLTALCLRTFRRLLRTGAAPFAFISIISPDLFGWVFGPNWSAAGIYARWLAPWLLLVYVGSPLSVLPSLLERQFAEMLLHGCMFVARLGALLLAITLFGTPIHAVALFGGASALFWIALVTWYLRLAGVSPWLTVREFATEIGVAACVVAPIVVAEALPPNVPAVADLLAVLLTATLIVARILYEMRRDPK